MMLPRCTNPEIDDYPPWLLSAVKKALCEICEQATLSDARTILLSIDRAASSRTAQSIRKCNVCGVHTDIEHDHKPDNTGLDDGPPLPDARMRRYPKKSPDEYKSIRDRAWETRRAKYGEKGHR